MDSTFITKDDKWTVIDVDGTKVRYTDNLFTRCTEIEFEGQYFSVPEPLMTETGVKIAVCAYRAGYSYGKHIGRQNLKADFDRLMRS